MSKRPERSRVAREKGWLQGLLDGGSLSGVSDEWTALEWRSMVLRFFLTGSTDLYIYNIYMKHPL